MIVGETPVDAVKRFHNVINPTKVPDGHCFQCAVNAYLGLIGHPLMAAAVPRSDISKFAGDYLFDQYIRGNFVEVARTNNGLNLDIVDFEENVSNTIRNHCPVGDVVLLCLDGGDHWYVAINLLTGVVFIDAQKCMGFNVHIKEVIKDSQFQILHIPEAIINDYYDIVGHGIVKRKRRIKKGSKRRKGIKKRKGSKKR